MSNNDKFYRTLAVIAVVAIVAIAVVVVGPKLLEGGANVSDAARETTRDAGQKAEEVVEAAGEAVDTITSPVSSVPAEAGVTGITAMMVADPKYHGGSIRAVGAEECGFDEEFMSMIEPSDSVFMKYDETIYVFLSGEDKYFLVFLYNESVPGLNWDGGPMPVALNPNDPENLPPITTKEAYVEAFSE